MGSQSVASQPMARSDHDLVQGRLSSAARKSERTRSAILASARRRFTETGFDLSSMRGIATEAGVDPALVIRYFGTKERLFVAAVRTTFPPADLEKVPSAELGAAIVRHALDVLEHDNSFVTLLRTAMTNPFCVDLLSAAISVDAEGLRARLPDRAGADERIGLIVSQLMGIAFCMSAELRLLDRVDRDELVGRIAPAIQRYLDMPLPLAGQMTDSPHQRDD
jgi:AcrR family transcriptional regulator